MDGDHCQQRENKKEPRAINQKDAEKDHNESDVNWIASQREDPSGNESPGRLTIDPNPPRGTKVDEGQNERQQA